MLRFVLAAVSLVTTSQSNVKRPACLVVPHSRHKESSSGNKQLHLPVLDVLPDVIDYRLSGGAVTPVKDQGACGSCWAFSAAEALEGQLGMNGHETNVSAQNFVDCVSLDYGCGGGWMNDAFAYAEENGVEKNSAYPYTGVAASCAENTSQPLLYPTAYVKVNKSNHGLRTALVTFGPLSIALDATTNFMQYDGKGVLTDDTCDGTTPNHALLLVGYNNIEGYWVIKNSWGAEWGRQGYVYMNNSQENACGVAAYATAAYVAPGNPAEAKARIRAHLQAVPIAYRKPVKI